MLLQKSILEFSLLSEILRPSIHQAVAFEVRPVPLRRGKKLFTDETPYQLGVRAFDGAETSETAALFRSLAEHQVPFPALSVRHFAPG